jgi:hypothetical protein
MIIPGFTAEHPLERASRPYGYYRSYNHSIPKGEKTMETQQTTTQAVNNAQVDILSSKRVTVEPLMPQQGDQSCPTCGHQVRSNTNGGFVPSFIYALGRIEPRFPTIGVEKEFVQTAGRAETKGLTDRQALHDVLKHNRYLVRQLCWVFSVRDLATYILQPRDPADFELLMESLRRDPSPMDIDVVIGVRGPIAPPELCNGLMVPIVVFDQLYSFDRDSLLKGIPRPDHISEEDFKRMTEEVLEKFMLMADNAGNTDEDRALNYLAVRFGDIYRKTAEWWLKEDKSFTGIDVRPSRLSGTRKIVDVIFSYTNRKTDVVEKYLVRVDVTEEFPFLVTKWSYYVEH